MSKKSSAHTAKAPAERLVRSIRRATHKHQASPANQGAHHQRLQATRRTFWTYSDRRRGDLRPATG